MMKAPGAGEKRESKKKKNSISIMLEKFLQDRLLSSVSAFS
jgi:hypothetical protein